MSERGTAEPMGRRLRVALLSFDFGEYCIRLASAMAETADVALLLPEHEAAGYHAIMAPGVRFYPFAKPRLRQPLRQLRMLWLNLRRIRQFDPDIVHIQQGHLWFNPALPLLARYPLVVTVHDPHHHLGDRGAQRTPQGVMDFGFRRAARLIVHSGQLKQVVVDRCQIPERIVDVISHIALGDEATPMRPLSKIPLTPSHPHAPLPVRGRGGADVTPPDLDGSWCTDEAKGPQGDGEVVLFFGRIWPYKGLEYLIRAEPLIAAEFPQAKIVIAGEGEDFGRYRQMMTNPERFIVWNEYLSDERRAEMFKQASVVVLPYVEASQSGVIPLAYRFGKPVVATTVGGLPDMVDDGETGFLVPPRDERALADAILRLLRDGKLRDRLGAQGRRKLDAECAPAVVAEQTLDVYRRALVLDHADAAGSVMSSTAKPLTAERCWEILRKVRMTKGRVPTEDLRSTEGDASSSAWRSVEESRKDEILNGTGAVGPQRASGSNARMKGGAWTSIFARR